MKYFGQAVTNRLLAMKFLSEFILVYPLIPIMYGEHAHISSAGIGFLFGLGFALLVVFEVPTGIIADKFSRKYVLLTSLITKLAALGLWVLAPSFKGYLMATVLFSLSQAFESGTLQAYLYGTVARDSKRSFGRFWARVHAMVMLSYTTAYILTTLIGINYGLLLTISLIPVILAILVCLTLPRDNLESSSIEVRPKIFKTAIDHIKGSPELIKLLMSGVVIVGLAQVMVEFLSLYYKQVGISTRWVPIMMAIGNTIGALLFWSLHSWEKTLDRWRLLLLGIATSIFIVSLQGGVASAVIGAMLFTRFIRLLQVQYESSIQHLSNDQARATISSVGSFAASLLTASIMITVGQLATDNIILRPLRLILLVGVICYAALQLLTRARHAQVHLEQ
jgi:MFS family permease